MPAVSQLLAEGMVAYRTRSRADYHRRMQNALSVDLEDYYQVTAFADSVDPTGWNDRPSRVEANTERLLELMAACGCQATFFTLGWVGERYPKLIRKIAEAGHEIACHSHLHRLVYTLSVTQFRDDTKKAKQVLECAGGCPVKGYRAPSFSITRQSLWAFEVLAELGFTYDSSIYPIEHLNYGMPGSPRLPFLLETSAGPIVEFPMPTLAAGNRRSPIGGGAYLRLLPYSYTSWAIRYINSRENSPVCVYLHPWELDTEQPKLHGSLTAKMRHYFGLRGMEGKLRKLLKDFSFVPVSTVIASLQPVRTELTALQ